MSLETVDSQEEAKHFLEAEPNHYYESRILGFIPNIPFLKSTPELPFEIGLYLHQSVWILIRGHEFINDAFIPKFSNPKIHSHFSDDTDGSVPSVNDFNIISNPYKPPFISGRPYIPPLKEITKNIIVSDKGMTEYWPITDDGNRRIIAAEVYRPDNRFGPGTEKEYLVFLAQIEAHYQLHNWDNLDEEKLNQLLKPL